MTKDIWNRLTLDECTKTWTLAEYTKDVDTGRMYQRHGHWQGLEEIDTCRMYHRDVHLQDVPKRCTLARCTNEMYTCRMYPTDGHFRDYLTDT